MSRLQIVVLLATAAALAGACSDGEQAEAPTDERRRVDPAQVSDQRLREAIEEAESRVARGAGADDWGRLGHVYLAHDFEASALDAYLEARKLEPEAARWHYYVGLAESEFDAARAADAFLAASALDPSSIAALMRAALALKDSGDLDQARSRFNEVLALTPRLAAAELGLGQIALEEGAAEAARLHLLHALELQPSLDQAHAGLARAYLALGQPALARRHGNAARSITSSRSWPDPLYDEVEAAGVSKHWLLRRAKSYLNAGRYSAALLQLEPLATAAEPDPVVWSDRGAALLGLGRDADAERSQRRALEAMDALGGEDRFSPEIREATHTNLGIALARQGQLEAAEASFRKALEAAPGSAAAVRNLALLLENTGRHAEALEVSGDAR